MAVEKKSVIWQGCQLKNRMDAVSVSACLSSLEKSTLCGIQISAAHASSTQHDSHQNNDQQSVLN